MPVINNNSKPKSVFKKNNNAVCYHTVHEFVAMGKSLTTRIVGDKNPADLLNKVNCSGKKRYLVNNILHDVYDGVFKLYTVAE